MKKLLQMIYIQLIFHKLFQLHLIFLLLIKLKALIENLIIFDHLKKDSQLFY